METIREEWIRQLRRIADPVLHALEQGMLKRVMPVESGAEDRTLCAHMEAFGRLLTGIAPWVELPGDSSEEGATPLGIRGEGAARNRHRGRSRVSRLSLEHRGCSASAVSGGHRVFCTWTAPRSERADRKN